MSSLRTEEEPPALPVGVNKSKLEELCTVVKGIVLEGEDSPMEECSIVDLVCTEASPSPSSCCPAEPPTPMDISNGAAGWVISGSASDDECHTPRGEEYRIPEIVTCPPAPRRPSRNTTVSLNSKKYFCSAEVEELLEQEDDVVRTGGRSL